ncbi:MAG: hypothetical protein C4343_03480, partial [Chloroflexota bacterium]
AVAVDVPAAIVLASLLGTPGLALAIGLGAWLEVALLAVWLNRLLPGFHPRSIVRAGVDHGLGAILVAVVVLAVDRVLLGALDESANQLAVLGRAALASAG